MGKLRKISSFLLAAALLFSMAVPVAAEGTGAAQNLFLNGDFEGDTIDGTIWYAKDSAIVDLSEEEGVTGRTGRALKIVKGTAATEKEAYFKKEFDFKAGHRYLLRFWYYCPQNTLSVPEGSSLTPAIKGKVNSSNKVYAERDAWTLVQSSFIYAEGNEKTVYVIRIQNCDAGATVYIDDLLLVDLTEAIFDGSMDTNEKWSVSGEAPIETEGAYQGTGMMKLDGKATASQLTYMGTVADDYMLKGLVKTGEGYQDGDAEVRVYKGIKDESTNNTPIFTKSLNTASVWSEVIADNLIANDQNIITVEFENTGGACVYLDAFTLGASTNLVVNGGFERENPTEGVKWSSGAITDEDAKSGDYSYKATYTTTTATPQIQRMPCKPNTTYTVTYSLKGTVACGYTVTTFEGETSLGENPKKNYLGEAYRTGNWETVSFSFTTGETVTHMSLAFAIRAAGTYYFDDVSIYEEYPHETAFRDADGEGIYEIYEGMPVGFTAKYAWTAENEGTCLFAVVLYKEVNGVKNLEKVFLENCTYTAGDTLLSQDIEWDAVTMEDGAAYTMKCMVWDDMTTLNPAEKAYSIRSY